MSLLSAFGAFFLVEALPKPPDANTRTLGILRGRRSELHWCLKGIVLVDASMIKQSMQCDCRVVVGGGLCLAKKQAYGNKLGARIQLPISLSQHPELPAGHTIM